MMVSRIERKYYQYSTINLDSSDPNDPDVTIKFDVSNTFNTTKRAFTLDMISGRSSCDYTFVFKRGDVILCRHSNYFIWSF
jgi:hypothetical protein